MNLFSETMEHSKEQILKYVYTFSKQANETKKLVEISVCRYLSCKIPHQDGHDFYITYFPFQKNYAIKRYSKNKLQILRENFFL